MPNWQDLLIASCFHKAGSRKAKYGIKLQRYFEFLRTPTPQILVSEVDQVSWLLMMHFIACFSATSDRNPTLQTIDLDEIERE